MDSNFFWLDASCSSKCDRASANTSLSLRSSYKDGINLTNKQNGLVTEVYINIFKHEMS